MAFADSPTACAPCSATTADVTWGDEIVLTDDAGSHDLGYPRSVQRADGAVVTVYYTTDRLGGEGYLAATIWTP